MERVKYLVMDVDGTLTDGKIYMSNDGEIMKAFNIKDGYGIHDLLMPMGVIPVIITGRSSDILTNRCKELGITYIFQGVLDKTQKLDELLINTAGSYSNVAYIGDDLNDLTCMEQIILHGGIVGCPADSALEVKKIANYTCKNVGGNGAVREFIEWIIKEGMIKK